MNGSTPEATIVVQEDVCIREIRSVTREIRPPCILVPANRSAFQPFRSNNAPLVDDERRQGKPVCVFYTPGTPLDQKHL